LIRRIAGAALLVLTSLFPACQNETILTEIGEIPSDPVSYATQVNPIFQATCGGALCHISQATNGVDLSTHDSALSSVGLVYGINVIEAGNATDSPIIDKISPSPENGSRMPLNAPTLSSEQIQTIRDWINQGAKDN